MSVTRYLVFRRDPDTRATNGRGDGEKWEHVAGGLRGGVGYIDAESAEEALRCAVVCRGEGLAPGDEFEVYPVEGAEAFAVGLDRTWRA